MQANLVSKVWIKQAGPTAAEVAKVIDTSLPQLGLLAQKEKLLPGEDELIWLVDPTPFIRTGFTIRRTFFLNYLTILLAKVPILQKTIYHSSISPFIYSIVNHIRGNSAQTRR